MPQYHRYTRPRGTVHDLPLALSLKDQGTNILCVSDATLYVLQNFLALDLEFKSRWAVEKLQDYYYPISPDHALYGQWVNLLDQIRAEVQDMSCEIVPVLEEIRDNIELSTTALTNILAALEEQTTALDPDDTLVDDVEPILDAINVILGGAAILGA